MRPILFALFAFVLASPLSVQPVAAQQAAAQGNTTELRFVVVDETGAGIPAATVTIKPAAGEPIVVMGDERGRATSPALAPTGTVTVEVDYPGFQPYSAPLALRRGPINHTITLKIAGVTEEVVVNEASQDLSRESAATTALTQAEIDALPDDAEELQAMLESLAGPGGATFYMNGFRGGRLPNKDEIRAIRIRQNSFAADGHDAGRTNIEILTRPSSQMGGNLNLGFKGDNWNARNALAKVETPEGEKNAQLNIRGPIVKGRSAFSLGGQANDGFQSNTIIAIDESGNPLGSQVRSLNERQSFNLSLEHSLNNNQSIFFAYQGQRQNNLNHSGQFDLPERGRRSDNESNLFRVRLQGIVGKAMLHETRFEMNRSLNEQSSLTEAETIRVQDAFTKGGAGVASRRTTNTWEFADNLDFSVGRRHQMRVGLLVEGGLYETFDEQNKYGTTTYATLADYLADRPLQFSQRIGTVDTSFRQYQAGIYWQDDWRVNNKFSIGYGIRNEMQSHIGDKLNLMPRAGFTWNVLRNTTIRGGYGLYYDWYESNLYDTTLRLNGISQTDLTIRYEYDEFGNPIGVPQVLAGGRTQAASNLDQPYQHQMSLSVDRQLMANWQVGASYTMLRGRNQFRARDINTPSIESVDAFGNLVLLRPDQAVGIITQFDSDGKTESDRLQVQTRFQLPGLQRLFFNVNYTLQQAQSFANGATALPSNSLNPDLDWGPSGSDVRHQLSGQGQLPLPWGIRGQVQFQVQSAPAYNMTTGRDDNRDGVVNDRPIGVSRNSLRGNGYWNIQSLRLTKQLGLGGSRDGGAGAANANRNQNANNARYSFEVFVQAQNPLNRVITTGYTGNILSPFFGRTTGVQQARRVNFGMGLRF